MKKHLLSFFAVCMIYVGANAQCSVSFTYAVTNESVTVGAVGSPTASIAGYGWQWGDGGFGQGQTSTHTYTASGTYSVCVTYGVGALPPCTAQVCENIAVVIAAVQEIEKSLRHVRISPNPASNLVKLEYSLSEPASMDISLMDVTGKVTATLESGTREPGNHTFIYDTADLAKGLYFVRFKTKYATEVKKLIIE